MKEISTSEIVNAVVVFA